MNCSILKLFCRAAIAEIVFSPFSCSIGKLCFDYRGGLVTFSHLFLASLYHPPPKFARFFYAAGDFRKQISTLQSAECKLFPSSQKQKICIEHFKKVHFHAISLHFLRTAQKDFLSTFPDLRTQAISLINFNRNSCSLLNSML